MFATFFQSLVSDWGSHPATVAIGGWGAVVSTVVGIYTVWDKQSQKRIRLDVTYGLTTQEGASDKIVIVFLSPLPVHVADWSLTWRPNWRRLFLPIIDAAKPDHEGISFFTIPAQGSYTLEFSEGEKFDWRYRIAQHRNLYLTLHLFGGHRRRVIKLRGS